MLYENILRQHEFHRNRNDVEVFEFGWKTDVDQQVEHFQWIDLDNLEKFSWKKYLLCRFIIIGNIRNSS